MNENRIVICETLLKMYSYKMLLKFYRATRIFEPLSESIVVRIWDNSHALGKIAQKHWVLL